MLSQRVQVFAAFHATQVPLGVQNRFPLVPIQGHISGVDDTTSHLFTTHFNIILVCPGIQCGPFSYRHQNPE